VTASSETVDCSKELERVEEQKEKLKADEEAADRAQQEAAAKKSHLGEQRGLLDKIAGASAAWEAARDVIVKQTQKVCDDLASCANRTSPSLGDDATCLNKAYDERATKRRRARSEARRLKHELAVADADLTQATDDLQWALDEYNSVLADFTAWMTKKSEQIKARQAAFLAARGGESCDPKEAWILLRLAQASCTEFDKKKDICLAKEMSELLEEIKQLQEKVRKKETAKAVKAAELTATQALLRASDTDVVAAILVLFAKCKQANASDDEYDETSDDDDAPDECDEHDETSDDQNEEAAPDDGEATEPDDQGSACRPWSE
jgi:hypothetical protein